MKGELPLSPEDVAEIVAILDQTPYERIDVRTRRFRLSVARSGDGWVQSWEGPAEVAGEAAIGAATAPASGATVPNEDEAGTVTIRSPLPGTFYRAPQPGAPPFVEVGSLVGPETVVAIIETMKLMSPVHAGSRGRVKAILVENAGAVDANAVLIRIQTDGA